MLVPTPDWKTREIYYARITIKKLSAQKEHIQTLYSREGKGRRGRPFALSIHVFFNNNKKILFMIFLKHTYIIAWTLATKQDSTYFVKLTKQIWTNKAWGDGGLGIGIRPLVVEPFFQHRRPSLLHETPPADPPPTQTSLNSNNNIITNNNIVTMIGVDCWK